MATVGDLIVNLRADVASFTSGMDQARRSLDDFGKTGKQTQSSIEELTSWVKGLAAVQFAEAGMRAAEFVKSITEGGAQIAAMARQVNLSVEGLQTFQVAALKSSVSQDILNRSIEFFTSSIGKVQSGESVPAAVHALKDLYGSLDAANKAFQSMSPDQFLADVIKRLGELGDAYKANDDARELFGRGGQEMIRLSAQMADGIDKEIAKFKDLGLLLSRDDIKAMEEVNTELSLMGKLAENDAAKGILALIGALRGALSGMNAFAGAIQHVIDLALPRYLQNLPAIGALAPATGSNEMMAMSAEAAQGPAPWETGGGNKPPLLDADAIKKSQEFQTEYAKLIAQYQLDLDYQTRLRAAYDDSAAAVRALEVAHAGELAAEKVRQDAARLGITATQAQITAAYGLAAADEQAKKVVADYTAFQRPYDELLTKYREDIEYQDRLRAAYGQSAEAVRALQIAHAGEVAAMQEWNAAQKLGISISRDQLKAVYDLAAADEQAKLLAQEAKKGEDEFSKGLSEGLVKASDAFINATTNSRNLKSAWQELSQGALAFSDDIEKMIIKLLVINPLLNSLMGKKAGEPGALPTADTSKLFGGLLSNGGSAGPAGGGPGGGGGIGDLAGKAISGIAGYFKSPNSSETGSFADLGSLFGGLFASATSAGASTSDLADFAQSMMASDVVSGMPGMMSLVPGFATGGDFTVGGGGGIDSQMVAFRATPGERVMVRTPAAAGAASAGAQGPPTVNMTVVTPDANSFRQAQGQIMADAHRHLATAAARNA